MPALAEAAALSGRKRPAYVTTCGLEQAVSGANPALIRGYGAGPDADAAKLAALKDIAERVNARVLGEVAAETRQRNGKVDQQVLISTRVSSEMQVEDAAQICADSKDPARLWHVVFELDTRPPVTRLGQRLGLILQRPASVRFVGNSQLIHSELAQDLAAAIATGAGGRDVDVPLRLRRQHGGWYLLAGAEQVRLRNEDLFRAFRFPAASDLSLMLLASDDGERRTSQLVEGNEFSLRVDSIRGGYLSLFNIYADGRVSLLFDGRRLADAGHVIFPDAGQVLEAGLLSHGVPTSDIYLAVVTEQPLKDVAMHQLREGQGQVSGETSYQLDAVLALLETVAVRMASLTVTTLPR